MWLLCILYEFNISCKAIDLQGYWLKREKRSSERKLKKLQETEPDTQEEDYEDAEVDEEYTEQPDEDEDRDVITQMIDGEDGEVDSDDEDTIFVPSLRTLTRSGRLAGSWKKKHFAIEEDLREDENSSDESDISESDQEEDHQSDEISQESDTPDEGATLEELPEPAAAPEATRSLYSGRTRKPNPKYCN